MFMLLLSERFFFSLCMLQFGPVCARKERSGWGVTQLTAGPTLINFVEVTFSVSHWCHGFPGKCSIIGQNQINVTRATANWSTGEAGGWGVPQAVVSFWHLVTCDRGSRLWAHPRSQRSFNWIHTAVWFAFVVKMETFRFRGLLFIPLVCDYFNFVAFVIGGYPVDVYLGGQYYPETVNAAWNHEVVLCGFWCRVRFVVKASVYTYVCFIYRMRYLLLSQHSISPRFSCQPSACPCCCQGDAFSC